MKELTDVIKGRGTSVETWVSVTGSCPITCEVGDRQAQVRFGVEHSFALEVLFTEEALEDLVHTALGALRTMRGDD